MIGACVKLLEKWESVADLGFATKFVFLLTDDDETGGAGGDGVIWRQLPPGGRPQSRGELVHGAEWWYRHLHCRSGAE